ncbi:MAG: flagellar protein FliT [Rhodocyclales bacterium]|nr:flagellar protein FliT [Rhodocyclales bacterium]
MGSIQAVANYEQLSVLTRQMRETAEQGEWDKLISIEHQCSELVVAMRAVDASVTLDDAARQRKDQLIADILADHGEIRKNVQIWMGQLQHKMQSNRQEQLVLKTYGA